MFLKVFDENWKSREMEFAVGQTTIDPSKSKLYPGINGIEFSMSATDALTNKYNPKNKVALVRPEPEGEIVWRKNTSLCEALYVIKELTWEEVFVLAQAEKIVPQLAEEFKKSTENLSSDYQTELSMCYYGFIKESGVIRNNCGKDIRNDYNSITSKSGK